MRHVPMPADAGDDVILDQCKRPGWDGYRERWLAAAAAYRDVRGDPWRISAANFNEAEADELRDLYNRRRKNGPIQRIRRPEGGFPSCPMCGSSGGRSLDHALPKALFPEFSIVRENLVPACTICNSDEKGVEYRGTKSPERHIHPYYDRWARRPIWQVQFGPDLDAVVFVAMPSPRLSRSRRRIVEYHLASVLGAEWLDNSRRYWGSLPQLIRNRAGSSPSPGLVAEELHARLADETLEKGENGWHPAFLRGTLSDPRIPEYIASRVTLLPR